LSYGDGVRRLRGNNDSHEEAGGGSKTNGHGDSCVR
jgi:hypothetical protein